MKHTLKTIDTKAARIRRTERRAAIHAKFAWLESASRPALSLACGVSLSLFVSLSPAHATGQDLAASFKAVCESAFVKSENLQERCEIGDMPDALQDGSRFSERSSIGTELNVLARNIALAK